MTNSMEDLLHNQKDRRRFSGLNTRIESQQLTMIRKEIFLRRQVKHCQRK
jgi:hypothetical protein